MKKMMISITSSIYDVIKSNADLEKRSATNYVQCIIENIFTNNNVIKSTELLHITYGKDYNKLDMEIIKKPNTLKKNVDSINNDFIFGDDKTNEREISNVVEKSINKYNIDSSDTYDSYIELEELGKKIKLDNDNKPEAFKSYSFIFGNNVSNHARGWLYKNPTRSLEDYKKTFPNIF